MQELDQITSSISIEKEQQQQIGQQLNLDVHRKSANNLSGDDDSNSESDEIQRKMMEGRIFNIEDNQSQSSPRDVIGDLISKKSDVVKFGELGIVKRFGLVDETDSGDEQLNQNISTLQQEYYQVHQKQAKPKCAENTFQVKRFTSLRNEVSSKKKKIPNSKKDKTINQLSLMTTSESTNHHKSSPKNKKKKSPYHHLLIKQIQKNRQLEHEIIKLKKQNRLLRNVIQQFEEDKGDEPEIKQKQLKAIKKSKLAYKKLGSQVLYRKKAIKTQGSFDKHKQNGQKNVSDMQKSLEKFFTNTYKLPQTNNLNIMKLKSNTQKIWKKKIIKTEQNCSKRVL